MINYTLTLQAAFVLGISALAVAGGLFTLPAHADDYKIIYRDITFAITPVSANNAERVLTENSSRLFNQVLNNSGLFSISDDTLTAKAMKSLSIRECAETECSRTLGRTLKVSKIANLSIEKEFKTTSLEMTRYVTMKKTRVAYTVSARTIDIDSGGIECDFSEKAATAVELQKKAGIIAEKIVDYYRERRPFDKVPIVREKGPPLTLDRIAAYPTYISPMGKYSHLFEYALGVGGRVGGYFPEYKGARLFLDAGIFNMLETRDTVTCMQSLSLSAAGGYSMKFRSMEAVPYLGFGYIINVIKGDKDGRDENGAFNKTREYYYNPLLTAGIELYYSINRDFMLFLNPAYSIFFEPGTRSPYLQVNIGVARMLGQ